MDIQLNQTEKELFVLELVRACLEHAKESGKTFQEVLSVDVFVKKASNEFEQMVCSTIESLHKQGVITGTVEIEYETVMDADSFEETKTDEIDVPICIFENIAINTETGEDVAKKGFKEAGKDFWVKVKPWIGKIGETMIQNAVWKALETGLKAVGIIV